MEIERVRFGHTAGGGVVNFDAFHKTSVFQFECDPSLSVIVAISETIDCPVISALMVQMVRRTITLRRRFHAHKC